MARTQLHHAALALVRFGLGAGPTGLSETGSDPREWLLDQLTGPPATFSGLPRSAEVVQEALRRRGRGKEARKALRKEHRALYQREAAQRAVHQATTDRPFRERWVAFWANHFTVSVRRQEVLGLVGAYEREAIRPHVLGRFADLLRAVVQHPAMLLYLDNVRSIGPESEAGRGRDRRGLNENLAREILELHTLGVDGGYTQDDVIALARLLTGWSVPAEWYRRTDTGFWFHEGAHEPGPKTLLGTVYAQGGLAEGEAALDALARHPATARFVAHKLAVHFVADDPPASLVRRLERSFLDTDGDLAALARTLVTAPEPWQAPLTKIKQPWAWVASVVRSLGGAEDGEPLVKAQARLGQPVWAATSPAGWDDAAPAWIGPEALMKRVDLASRAAQGVAEFGLEPTALAEAALGPLLSAPTREAVAGARHPVQALAVLYASPDFQRR